MSQSIKEVIKEMDGKEMEKNKLEIMLVEDNLVHQDIVKTAIEKNEKIAEVNTHFVKDGAEALEYLFGFVDTDEEVDNPLIRRPQLIILDLRMPKVDGIDVLKKIKSHPEAKDIPIAILTSSQDQMDLIESQSFNVDCFLRKSMSFDELVEATGWAIMNAIQSR